MRTLRVYDLTDEQRARFDAYLTTHDESIWEALYEEQQAEDERRAERRDHAAGRPVPLTPFNVEALK